MKKLITILILITIYFNSWSQQVLFPDRYEVETINQNVVVTDQTQLPLFIEINLQDSLILTYASQTDIDTTYIKCINSKSNTRFGHTNTEYSVKDGIVQVREFFNTPIAVIFYSIAYNNDDNYSLNAVSRFFNTTLRLDAYGYKQVKKNE